MVSKHDVACCNSDEWWQSSDEESGSSGDSRDSYDDYPEPECFRYVRCPIGTKVQLRDAKLRLPRCVWVSKIDQCSASMPVRPPSESPSVPVDSQHSDGEDSFAKGHFGNEFMRRYHLHFNRNSVRLPADACMSNKWPGKMLRSRGHHSTARDVAFLAQLRNAKMGLLALRSRRQIGHVARHQACAYIYNLEGRRIGVSRAVMRVDNGHHVGRNCQYHGIPPPSPNCVRIVFIDVRKVRWCSVDSISLVCVPNIRC